MTGAHHYRAVVQYDGTDFLGYQIQATGRTVQGEIEKALNQVTQTHIRIKCAGRTDAGVHATGQVISFWSEWRHSLAELHRALNATVPRDIVIHDLRPARPDFEPRFKAISRTYHYHIINQRWPEVLQRCYAYHVIDRLDVAAMNEACQFLIGSHNFASFGKPPTGHKTVRQVMAAVWEQQDDSRLVFKITANAFLYRMARTVVGTLVQVGAGHIAPPQLQTIVEAQDLQQSAPPAPAYGLRLVRVGYPDAYK